VAAGSPRHGGPAAIAIRRRLRSIAAICNSPVLPMTTTMTRQQLAGQFVTLCALSIIIGMSLVTSFEYWLRGNAQFFFQLGIVVIFAALLVFVFRKLLNSFQPSPR
jgi:hypothetical protein